MAQATQLNATEQDTLVKQIGLALLRGAPRDWRTISANYRAVGRYHELDGEIILADGSAMEWVATHDIATLFGRLRAGMYRDQRGTWFNARYKLEAPASYNLEYDREEPEWNLLPPAQAYADELRMYARSEENVPEWLMRRLAGLGPERPGPRFRIARVFDGTGPSGKPVINRAELLTEEEDRLLDYLGDAPIVLPGRGYDIDRLAATPEPRVPVAFHSDGTWIWPGAVNYYLREYGVSPEPELVAHIKANNYTVPTVPDEQLSAANAYLTRGDTAPPPTAPGAPPMPRAQHAPAVSGATRFSAPAPASFEDAGEVNGTEFTGRHSNGVDPGDLLEPTQAAMPPVPFSSEPSRAGLAPVDEESPDAEDVPALREGFQRPAGAHAASAVPGAPAGAHAADDVPGGAAGAHAADDGPGAPDVPAIDDLRGKLDELGVADSAYRIGAPAERGWSLERVSEGWQVGWYDNGLRAPSVFDSAEDASAFMLGKLLLAPRGRPGQSSDEQRAAHAAPAPSPETLGVHEHPEPGFADESRDYDDDPDLTHEPHSYADEDTVADEPSFAEELERPSEVARALEPDLAEPEEPPREPVSPPRAAANHMTLPAPPPPRNQGAPDIHLPPPVSPPPTVYQPPVQPARAAAPAASRAPSQPVLGQQWPIQPMPGEPPLTLFRGKELRDLPAGSEVDRFGTPEGNLTYAAGTPFEERSLVPEWVNRPYHVYRVQRPIEALAGVAIPWFNQPGGGSAYLLPASIEELLADGVLIELDPGDPPVD